MDTTNKRTKTPWPTDKAMIQVYEKHLWGGVHADFYSGEGSHDAAIVNPYLRVITDFLEKFSSKLAICDLGCGDFNIGKNIVPLSSSYTAVDIVPALIARNKDKFQELGVDFQCLDIATAKLPTADCVIIRQVLQHLSNAEVQAVVDKLTQYKYIILTEHLPSCDFTPNLDIISGQGIRLKKNSGLLITKVPFNFKPLKTEVLLEIPLESGKGKIVTTLYQTF